VVLTEEYYYSLKDHAIPFDFRALKAIQAKPRAQDIYLWMTQRLCRIPKNKPLLMRWRDLHEMFGGRSTMKKFKEHFPQDLKAAVLSYPAAQVEEHLEGFLFNWLQVFQESTHCSPWLWWRSRTKDSSGAIRKMCGDLG
jgi:hypothetical protein